MARRRSILTAASPAIAVLALCTPAQAATLTTSACVPAEPDHNARTMPVMGSGFRPNTEVSLLYSTLVSPSPTFLSAVTADATGRFSARVVPPLASGFAAQERTLNLTATDEGEPAVEATTSFRHVRRAYTTTPSVARATSLVRHSAGGLTPGRNAYAHFRFRSQTQRNVFLGRTSRPCGRVSRRMALLPANAKPGRWTIYADNSRAFSLRTRPQVSISLVVGPGR